TVASIDGPNEITLSQSATIHGARANLTFTAISIALNQTATVTGSPSLTFAGSPLAFFLNGSLVSLNANNPPTGTFTTQAKQLAAGTHAITAQYKGDSNYNPSHLYFPPFWQSIKATASSIIVTPYNVVYGGSYSMSASMFAG